MSLKNFRWQCTARVFGIALSVMLLTYLALHTSLYATMTVLLSLTLYQLWALIFYVEKSNREMVRFLESIRYSDFSQTYSGGGRGDSFDTLSEAFIEVSAEFQKARAEKEESYQYLQTVVQHINIGLIAFQPDYNEFDERDKNFTERGSEFTERGSEFTERGSIQLMNTAAKRLLRQSPLPMSRALTELSELSGLEDGAASKLLKLRSGEKLLLTLAGDGDMMQVLVSASEFLVRSKRITLISLQNIQSELDEKEMEAWQTLIRVLTHEMMNSITPIASLSATMKTLLESPLSPETLGDVRQAAEIIERRSKGLIDFVTAYRNLTRIPAPNFQLLALTPFFKRIEGLMMPEMKKRGIDFHTSVEPETLEAVADALLLEQVLLNLLTNAIDAAAHTPQPVIKVSASLDPQSRTVIEVIDNGQGMSEELQRKVFIPFFTTKPNGSGIGLSLSRQIMRLHHGSLTLRSMPNGGSTFTLRF